MPSAGSFAPYNREIHGNGRFAILAAAAAKEAGMEYDSNTNGPFSFAQNKRQIHCEGKFGRGMMDDNGIDDKEDDSKDDDDGGRDIDFAPPHNCKFLMLAMAAAAENARVEDDSNSSVGTSDDRVINAGGKFRGVRMDDKCDDDGETVGTFGTFPQNPHVPTDAGFSLLAAIAADGGIGDDDNAYLNDDHDGTLTMCTSLV